jgi:hypothetical protein
MKQLIIKSQPEGPTGGYLKYPTHRVKNEPAMKPRISNDSVAGGWVPLGEGVRVFCIRIFVRKEMMAAFAIEVAVAFREMWKGTIKTAGSLVRPAGYAASLSSCNGISYTAAAKTLVTRVHSELVLA